MQPALVVIGLNHRMAPIEVRERFWMNAERRAEALATLSQAEAIEEIFVFSTCQRTEFVAWGDPTLAINSVLRFLTAKYNLKLREWNSFYRLLDETALAHAFRVSCGLDSMSISEGQIGRQAHAAWQQARSTGSTGRHLDAVLRKSVAVRRRVRRETTARGQFVSAPHAAAAVAHDVFGSLAKLNILVLGAGTMAETSVQALIDRGASQVCIINRTDSRAAELAKRLGVKAGLFEERRTKLATADVVISAVSVPSFLFTAAEIEQIVSQRAGGKLVLIDLALPRSVDPAARQVAGVILYDLDDLERTVKPPSLAAEGEVEAQKIILEEVHAFREEMAVLTTPTVSALRDRLDEICRQELESFRLERGPFPKDQDRLLTAVGVRITHRIAGSLARELKDVPEPRRMKTAV